MFTSITTILMPPRFQRITPIPVAISIRSNAERATQGCGKHSNALSRRMLLNMKRVSFSCRTAFLRAVKPSVACIAIISFRLGNLLTLYISNTAYILMNGTNSGKLPNKHIDKVRSWITTLRALQCVRFLCVTITKPNK